MSIDPVTLEVLQNRLQQIGWEAGNALIRTAASPVPVQSKDLGFNISDPTGRAVVYSVWMPRHGTTLTYMLRSCLERYGEGELEEGDMIMNNDPHAGALHISDIAVIAPVHFEGQLIAWAACATHHLDIGGMTPGWCPEATESYQEGIRFSSIKLVSRGELQQDVFKIFLDNVRQPDLQGHDLLAQVAANNVAKKRLVEVVKRYGPETILACYDRLIEFGELKTRERIKEIPNGEYEYVDYLDFDRVYRLHCLLTVKDGEMFFDFAGTDPQARSFINAALPCAVANIHNIITCMLLPDFPANEGCFKPIHITIPPGTIFSCQPPASCSGASVMAGWKAQVMTVGVLSKAFQRSPLWARATANWGWGRVTLQFSGRSQHGRWSTLTMTDGCMQGGGARATKDGVDCCNIPGSTNTSIANVESIEQRYPLLYLRRGLVQDTGGAGKHRGGLAGEYVIKPHNAESLDVVYFQMGTSIPSHGINGGLPGGTTGITLLPNGDVLERLKEGTPLFEELKGERISLPEKGRLAMREESVVRVRCQGGGGYGDPLERDVEQVARDVLEEYISPQQAIELYGVVMLDPARVDCEATTRLREQMRVAKANTN